MVKRQKKVDLRKGAALITGFPGFLATYLLQELLAAQPKGNFHLLVERRMRDTAQARLDTILDRVDFAGLITLIDGDITEQDLGIRDDKTLASLRKSVTVVWHLAAVYDLSVPELQAYRINVGGTNHVLDFCESCTRFGRLNYVSTCFVSGDRGGTVFEDELDEAQSHHNHYESTKFWAEIEIQKRAEVVPTAIFRPAIVVGHSQTGETDKYDGPYYLLKLLRKLPDWLPFPQIGNDKALINIVPVDFVAAAIAELGLRADTSGNTYHVADPHPMQASDIVDLALSLMEKAPSRGRLPPRLLGAVMESSTVEETVGIPRQVVRYFTHSVRYDTQACENALQDSDIRCPHLSTYLQVLIDYVDLHPEKEFLDRRRV